MRILSLLLLALAVGCTRYEYSIVEPPELAQVIGKEPATVVREPVAYHFATADNRLVMRIENRTDDPIQFVGPQSYVVDPEGQSHPLASETIAPRAFIKRIFPPMRPVYRAAPTWNFGVGVGLGRYYGRPWYHGRWAYGGWYDPWDYWYYDRPIYLEMSDPGNTTYWEWDGEGSMRLRLAFLQGEKRSHEDFVIARRKK